jgi:hypothetical protein
MTDIKKLEERVEGIEILLERLLNEDDDSELCDRVKNLERLVSQLLLDSMRVGQ